MKQHNKYRGESQEKVRKLESRFSLMQRLRDVLTSRRGLHKLRHFALYLVILIIIGCTINELYTRFIQKTYSAHIEHIKYYSNGILEQGDAIEILGLTTETVFATLNSKELQQKLESNPLIASAHVLKERPNTLAITITERLPIAFVKMENALGQVYPPEPLFIDEQGYLFPVNKARHTHFMDRPTWYLKSPDVSSFQVGQRVHESSSKPIVELLNTLERYSYTEIPVIKSIRCPKEWKILLSLETGTEVMMKNSDIPSQVDRLYQLLEHARTSNRRIRSANVIPSVNPAVTFFE